jgi:hypothetical protein
MNVLYTTVGNVARFVGVCDDRKGCVIKMMNECNL